MMPERQMPAVVMTSQGAYAQFPVHHQAVAGQYNISHGCAAAKALNIINLKNYHKVSGAVIASAVNWALV
ncbi:MAG: hypothetical protein MZU95_12225 [Desulfomicrobium escambiense]|nr:hypothetical protein [Desulfomicrobium escambiense]